MDESQPFVFLSYSRDDSEFVARLRTDLEARGFNIWIDTKAIQPGTVEWDEALRAALRACQAVVVIVSPNARSSRYIKGELRAAEAYGRPIYAVWASGSEWIEVVPLISLSGMQYIDAREPHYNEALPELVAMLKGAALARSKENEHRRKREPTMETRNPYKGLRAFTSADTRDFFGRDRLIEQLVRALKESLASEKAGGEHARLLAVIGPSGSGKSSVVLAGLLPRLQQGRLQNELPGSQQWVYLEPIKPGSDPIEELLPVLAEKLPDRDLGVLRKDLKDSSGLHVLAKMIAKSSQKRIVLIIDQFEELFTQTTSEDKRQQMIDLLMTAITESGGPVIVILTLRADFYDRPMRYPDFYQLIKDRQQEVLPMEMDELRAVVVEPAALSDVQVTFEDNLVGDLLFEMKGQAEALPLLQFTLDQLFQKRSGRLCTIAAYREMGGKIGGVKGVLVNYAESIYMSLPSEEHRRLARAVFLRLIDLGVTEQDTTRRHAALTEFQVPDAQKTAMLEHVVQTFITARLLTATTTASIPTVEVSHEVLIREWPRLSDWLREARDREDIALQKAISEDAAGWRRHDKDVDRLYRGTQLDEAQAWAERNLPSIDEAAFLESSIAERERQKHVEHRQKGYTRRTVLVVGLTGFVGLGLAVTGTFLVSKLLQPTGQTSNPLLPSPSPTPYSYFGHTDLVTSVAWSPDGTRIASGSWDQTVQVWDARTSHHLVTYTGHTDKVHDVTWSPDGTRIASGSRDKTVQVWDASTGRRLLTYRGHTGGIGQARWSPDGKHLASTSADKTVQVWDASTGTRLLTYTGHTGGVYSVTWSPDGKRLASASSDKTVQVWDASTGRRLLTYTGHSSDVNSVVWSPDGKRLASASSDKTVQVWDASTGTPLYTYTGHTGFVWGVVWSPDGRRLASASVDRTVQVWNISTGTRLVTYDGHTNPVLSVAWAPDGKGLASASDDKTVQVWNASTGTRLFPPYTGHKAEVNSVAWSPDDKRLASASWDKTVQVWDASTGAHLYTYTGHRDVVRSVAWSSDSKHLASASDDKTVQVWNASTGAHLFPPYTGHKAEVNSVVWSPDGKRLASASADTTVQVWDASTGTRLFSYRGHIDAVNSVAWSPDGKRLASASADTTVQVWDASTGTRLFSYRGHIDAVNSVAWSPDGKWIASAGADVQVWDATTGTHLYTYSHHTNTVYSVAWSPDGEHIASASRDFTVQVWLVLPT